jgi:4-hydroxy-tetrahydrodipicolinate synthase
MFEGVHTALVTPFADGDVDEVALRRLIDRQFDNGVTGVVPVGTTGESPTLNHDEHQRVIEITVEQTAGRGVVTAGTGSNSTREAIAMTQAAEKAGASACLLVSPYYNKPSQQGMFEHFKAIAESTSLPIVLYSISGRTGKEISVDTIVRLQQECPNILGAKEAEGSCDRVGQLVAECGDDFEVVSGDDSLTLPFMSVGAVGVISVASNLIPSEMSALVKAALANDYATARELHHRYVSLFGAFLKLDTNPVPIKTAMALAGLCGGDLRRPMIGMEADKVASLKATLSELGLLDS